MSHHPKHQFSWTSGLLLSSLQFPVPGTNMHHCYLGFADGIATWIEVGGNSYMNMTPILLKMVWIWLELGSLSTICDFCFLPLPVSWQGTRPALPLAGSSCPPSTMLEGSNPASGPRGAQKKEVRGLCLLEGACRAREQSAKVTRATEIQVAANGQPLSGSGSVPASTCLCLLRGTAWGSLPVTMVSRRGVG